MALKAVMTILIDAQDDLGDDRPDPAEWSPSLDELHGIMAELTTVVDALRARLAPPPPLAAPPIAASEALGAATDALADAGKSVAAAWLALVTHRPATVGHVTCWL